MPLAHLRVRVCALALRSSDLSTPGVPRAAEVQLLAASQLVLNNSVAHCDGTGGLLNISSADGSATKIRLTQWSTLSTTIAGAVLEVK